MIVCSLFLVHVTFPDRPQQETVLVIEAESSTLALQEAIKYVGEVQAAFHVETFVMPAMPVQGAS